MGSRTSVNTASVPEWIAIWYKWLNWSLFHKTNNLGGLNVSIRNWQKKTPKSKHKTPTQVSTTSYAMPRLSSEYRQTQNIMEGRIYSHYYLANPKIHACNLGDSYYLWLWRRIQSSGEQSIWAMQVVHTQHTLHPSSFYHFEQIWFLSLILIIKVQFLWKDQKKKKKSFYQTIASAKMISSLSLSEHKSFDYAASITRSKMRVV